MTKKEHEEKIKEIFNQYMFEIADNVTLDKVHSDVISYLYNNGYNDDSSSDMFKPIIPDVNYKLSIQDVGEIPYFQLELLEDGEWFIIKAQP